MIDYLTPVPLLSAVAFERQLGDFGCEPAGLELLVAIDRVLRSLAGAGLIDGEASAGFALSGPTALHCVYLISQTFERIPDELSFAPLARLAPHQADTFAALIATALPDGTVSAPVDSDPELYQILYTGTTSKRYLPLRIERKPLRLEPTEVDSNLRAGHAERAVRGFLYDQRMTFATPVSDRPLPVAVAYAEEILLRDIATLLTLGFQKSALTEEQKWLAAARVDDLRLAVLYKPEAVNSTFGLPAVREVVNQQLRRPKVKGGAPLLDPLTGEPVVIAFAEIIARLRSVVQMHDKPTSLPSMLRPHKTASTYANAQQHAFEAAFFDSVERLKDD
jgi:hypothetical protein